MLKELSIYQNLGTPNYFIELLRNFRDNSIEIWSIKDVRDLFYNRIIDGRNIFDGCIHLIDSISIVSVDSEELIYPDESFFQFLSSTTLMKDKIVEKLLITLCNDPIFHNIFCSEYISYDIVYKGIQIDNSAFPLKYSSFKQLLLDFDILKVHPTKELNKFILNSRFKKLFDKVILPEIRKRKMGIEELRISLEQRQIQGEEAEKFVLQFERERLNGNKLIDWVAEYSISEGYDIASFNDEKSIDNDRFIEVKSYSGQPYFFWSRNQIDIARIKKSNYFLYLVDRNKINKPYYTPLIIQNPYVNVLKNKEHWDQRIEKIKFMLKQNT